jgi:N-acetylglucosaminyl-diphospho-decaprenol L-rhamnosyltransferase
VVNWNAGDHLLACVRTLRDAGVGAVVVADNASSDGSVEQLVTEDAAVRVVQTGGNLGFGAAANRGAAVAETPYVAIGNPDVIVDRDAIDALARALDADPAVGAVGPRIENPDGSWYPSARAFPSLVDAAGHAFLHFVAPRNRFTRRYRLLDRDPAVACDVDWVSGTLLVVRRDAFEAVGGFDESYFMYVEDVDLSRRLRLAGWRIRYEPSARVVHTIGVSSERRPYRMILEHHRSLLRFSASTTRGARRALLPVVAAGLGLRALLSCLQRAVRRRPPAQL